MEKSVNKNILIAGGVLLVVIFFVGGFFLGKNNGQKIGEDRYRSIVETIYPKPSGTTQTLSGTVKQIYGATIEIEIDDPADYLPHTDGTPRARQIRFANTTPNTKYSLQDWTKFNANGMPTQGEIFFSNIKVGDKVTVESTENIFSTKEFDVTKVTVVKY